MRRAVFLDRDGVINAATVRDGKPYPPVSLDDLVILPGVGEALQALKAAGFLLIVVTNQPDVARGKTPLALVNGMNDRLKSMLPLDAVLTCFHDDPDQCDCRKPKPGLLLRAIEKYNIDPSLSYFIGDRERDVEAGTAAGVKGILIDSDQPISEVLGLIS